MQSFIRDWQDLQLKKDRSSVVKARDITYESSSCVLDSLKCFQLGGW